VARQALKDKMSSNQVGDKGSMRRKHQVHHSKTQSKEANLEKLIKKVSGIPNYNTQLHEFDEVTL
jgi:hypothetical protein